MQKMGHVHPPSWDFFRIRFFFRNLIHKRPSSDLAIFFFPPLAVMSGVWPLFGCIFSPRYLHRNICIWRQLCTDFNGIIISYTWPYSQGTIYRALGSQITPFLNNLTKHYFSKIQHGIVFTSTRSFYKSNKKVAQLLKNSIFDCFLYKPPMVSCFLYNTWCIPTY